MNRSLFLVGSLAIFSFASIATAGVSNPSGCTSTDPGGANTYGWVFQTYGSCGSQSGGVSFTDSDGKTITIFPELVKNGVVQTNTSNDSNPVSGLFEVQDNNHGNVASGIGPYRSDQSGSYFTSELGIQDSFSSHYVYTNGQWVKVTDRTDTMLFIEIGPGQFPAGTTLDFLMQQGLQSGDSVNVYWGNFASGQTAPPDLTNAGFTNTLTDVPVGPNNGNATVSQFHITLSALSNQITWIGIQADCEYLLLNKITYTSSPVPEPRFYGLLLTGLIGFIGIYARKRQMAVQNS